MAHLEISSREKEGVKILDLSGKLTVGGASDLREKVSAETSAGSLQQLLNLKEVEYIDSTGLGTMVICYMSVQKAGGALKLVQSQSPEPGAGAADQALHGLSDFQRRAGSHQQLLPRSRDQAFRHFQLRAAAKGKRRVSRWHVRPSQESAGGGGRQAPRLPAGWSGRTTRTLGRDPGRRPRASGVLQNQLPGLPAHGALPGAPGREQRAAGDRNLAGRCRRHARLYAALRRDVPHAAGFVERRLSGQQRLRHHLGSIAVSAGARRHHRAVLSTDFRSAISKRSARAPAFRLSAPTITCRNGKPVEAPRTRSGPGLREWDLR